jgi:hypothetical protein
MRRASAPATHSIVKVVHLTIETPPSKSEISETLNDCLSSACV